MFAAAALWLITSSPFALIFGALGPVIAIASVWDAKVSAKRTLKRELRRFATECDAAAAAVESAHAAERVELNDIAPGAGVLLARTAPNPEAWRASLSSPLPVRIGVGTIDSLLELSGETAAGHNRAVQQRLTELQSAAHTLTAAPVVVDARLGIGLCGHGALGHSIARALVLQLLAALPPSSTEVRYSAHTDALQWIGRLPHRSSPLPQTESPLAAAVATILIHPVGQLEAATIVAVASTVELLPRQARVIITVGDITEVQTHPEWRQPVPITPEFVTLREAALWATRQHQQAATHGLLHTASTLPTQVALADITSLGGFAEHTGDIPARIGWSLGCPIGRNAHGISHLDLIRDGPHAIIGGTTGSGKSELLVTWVLAMAEHCSPEIVTFLFVDFKGGASFEPLRELPHCVGVITDLNAAEALRALTSLRAEVRYRERQLIASGLRSLDEAAPGTLFPRLVIVVDEYAAMVDEHTELHTLFSDLAARGRSLGIHLILCTQRPAGVVRDSILANSGLRISLRVNNRADSIAVVGTDDAAQLGSAPRGRAYLTTDGTEPTAVQIALASAADMSRVSHRWAAAPRPRQPWCEPLPPNLRFADLELPAADATDDRIPFALIDLPDEQRRAPWCFDPSRSGHLLVVGAAGSGKTGVLLALNTAPTRLQVEMLPARLAVLWDCLTSALDYAGPARVLLIDDVDATLAACPEEYSLALVDMLTRVMREGPSRGTYVVLTAQRLSGPLHSLASLCGSTLVLRMPSRQDHLLSGADNELWEPNMVPGAGSWRGNRVQVVHADQTVASAPVRATAVTHLRLSPDMPLAVVSTRPRESARYLAELAPGRRVTRIGELSSDSRDIVAHTGGHPDILLGDPDSWQSRWGAIAAIRSTATIVFDGCSVAEFRSLTGIRELPPPPEPGQRALWALSPDEEVTRVTLVGEHYTAT
ncbi:MAG TPA: FtsK/SpoIIIE domain-containing protein [Glaciihabitans sp.]|jgi:S-DNA-T family DNA segregation ATPase FtsK/SpoIIIE|nr:FtsK/SpoIIIE domain-containing protein [Glaciihabitans sp.]